MDRTNKAITSLETFIESIHIQHVKASDIGSIMENYEQTAQKLDDRKQELELELKELEEKIQKETDRLNGPVENQSLRQRAAIGVFAPAEGEVEIVLIYGAFLLRFIRVAVPAHEETF